MRDEAYHATPKHVLEHQIMSPGEGKNEREWWACHEIEKLRARIAELEALVKELADELQVYICAKYVGRKGCPKSKRDEYDAAAEPVRKARDAISVNNQVKFDSSLDSADLRAARAALEKKND